MDWYYNAIVEKYKNAYLPHRSTEIALTLIINNIIIYLDIKPMLSRTTKLI